MGVSNATDERSNYEVSLWHSETCTMFMSVLHKCDANLSPMVIKMAMLWAQAVSNHSESATT
ncbi:hypothetical protein WN55_01436 [Dufourea novaeangliae]|uniref:Uncharacterized protein n=1 Tax=Dufourea novaeangliae TaxID=178035 RepID=A0A154PGM1_DUFNO|nr:hypothetical protein WN55_01436 [Dufourea novaeangliae]